MRRLESSRALAALFLVTGLVSCGGDDGPAGAAGAAGAGGAGAIAGCTSKVANLFANSKGSYSAAASTFDNTSPAVIPASVAGFANGANQTVTVKEDCTITIGAYTLSYKDGTYAEFPGVGADAGKTQYDVDLTGAGVKDPHFEVFTNTKRGLSLFDSSKTNQGVRFDQP